jgi:hypothetical protein
MWALVLAVVAVTTATAKDTTNCINFFNNPGCTVARGVGTSLRDAPSQFCSDSPACVASIFWVSATPPSAPPRTPIPPFPSPTLLAWLTLASRARWGPPG